MEVTIIQMPPDNYVDILFKGKMYKTLDGRVVKIIDDTYDRFPVGSHGRCVRGSDGSWRYGHSGRCTACPDDHPQNIMRLEMVKMPFNDRMYNLRRRIERNMLNTWRYFFDEYMGIFRSKYYFKKAIKGAFQWQQ